MTPNTRRDLASFCQSYHVNGRRITRCLEIGRFQCSDRSVCRTAIPPVAIAVCNSCSSHSKCSFTSINARNAPRRSPSHKRRCGSGRDVLRCRRRFNVPPLNSVRRLCRRSTWTDRFLPIIPSILTGLHHTAILHRQCLQFKSAMRHDAGEFSSSLRIPTRLKLTQMKRQQWYSWWESADLRGPQLGPRCVTIHPDPR
jgi:hypothetical protein